MGREPRYVPPNSLQHVVDVVFQNRPLLAPSEEVNRLFLGILGKAQRRYRMEICAVVVMSTHVHYLVRPRDGAHLAGFMCFVKTNLSKEIGRLRGWKGALFDHRYHSTTVSTEEIAQVRILRYVLSHGVKEFLVDRVRDWPGVHSASAATGGETMSGVWHDRSAQHEAGGEKAGAGADSEGFAHPQEVELSPLPCWSHLSVAEWRRNMADLVDEIDRDAADRRRETGRRSLGVAAVLAVDPMRRPNEVEKSPKPRFHGSDPKVVKAMVAIWREVLAAFRDASEKLRSGLREVRFPEGTFPPALPFVPFSVETYANLSRGRPF